MLAVMIERTKVDGVIPHLVDGGLCILQYTDDTILFMEHDFKKAKKSKIYFSCFRATFGFEKIA
jgi:hypothetical protein